MLKIFLTGDNHIGKPYNTYKGDKSNVIESRFKSMENMVREAEMQGCNIFAVAGDLFDRVYSIKKGDVRRVIDILSNFNGTVLVLPGNHDYYTGDEEVWQDFIRENTKGDIQLLNEYREYSINVADEEVVIYPAFCDAKHSEDNRLGWIRETSIPTDNVYRIGMAHGAIKGVSPDNDNKYFLMTEDELNTIPVDIWLIGHTHIQYPGTLKIDEDTEGYRIYNAGTHEQTDYSNNTEGACFIITVDKSIDKPKVLAHKYISGGVRYYDLELKLNADRDNSLRTEIEGQAKNLLDNSIVRIKNLDNSSIVRISLLGTLKEEEYEKRAGICMNALERFLFYEVIDHGLSEEITDEKIRREFVETDFTAKLLKSLKSDPTELSMAYELLKGYKE